MGNQRDFFTLGKKKGQRGQSTVEYILLLAVVVSLVSTVINSSYFKRFFGENSSFFVSLANSMERNYRYAGKVPLGEGISEDPVRDHPSFINTETSTSRFFITIGAYPNE